MVSIWVLHEQLILCRYNRLLVVADPGPVAVVQLQHPVTQWRAVLPLVSESW